MPITSTQITLALIVAAVTAGALVIATHRAGHGTERMRSILRAICRTVVIFSGAAFVAMLGWGLYSRDQELTYLSVLPLAMFLLTSKFMSRNAM